MSSAARGSAQDGTPAGLCTANTRAELSAAVESARSAGAPIAFVPTMGALHQGHASLIAQARQLTDGPVVVSIFVNPLQFGKGEDLDRYPRTLAADTELCAAHGADVIFAPGVSEVYPGGEPQVRVDPGPLGEILEGASRPGHFGGVLTVVAKLFGLVRPDVAIFGQKDYQQLTLIRRMVADLCLGVEIVGAPTVRDPDGLAMSSRNRYLSAADREAALALSRALRAAVASGAAGSAAALAAAQQVLSQAPGVELDYLVLTDPDLGALPATPAPGTEARILVAAKVGTTRLLDNLPLVLG